MSDHDLTTDATIQRLREERDEARAEGNELARMLEPWRKKAQIRPHGCRYLGSELQALIDERDQLRARVAEFTAVVDACIRLLLDARPNEYRRCVADVHLRLHQCTGPSAAGATESSVLRPADTPEYHPDPESEPALALALGLHYEDDGPATAAYWRRYTSEVDDDDADTVFYPRARRELHALIQRERREAVEEYKRAWIDGQQDTSDDGG